MFAGTVVLVAAIDEEASAEIVTVPLLLVGLGMGALVAVLGLFFTGGIPTRQPGAEPEARPPPAETALA
jgi:hypothetical protein